MNMKKGFAFIFALLVLGMSFCSAFSISSEPIVNSIVNNGEEPAIFDVTLINDGEAGDFEIYTFERFKIEPNNFSLEEEEEREIRFEFYPLTTMKGNVGHTPFTISVREIDGEEVASHRISVELVNFGKLFDVKADDVTLESDSVNVYFYNIENFRYEDIKVVFSSDFFDDTKFTIDLAPYQRYEAKIPINKNKLKKLVYGDYSITATYEIDGESASVFGSVKIIEKSGLGVKENKDGLIIKKYSIEKFNEGNIPIVADIVIKKNIISRLFSTFSIAPNKIDRKGFFVYYFWQKELQPDESLKMTATTNWTFPLIFIFLIGVIVYLFNKFISTNLIIKKKINFVKTKDNRFALRVILRVKARKYLEHIKIYDRVPGMASLFEKYGEPPTEVKNGRMRWDIRRMAEGEERLYSYIIHSKVNVVGKFELPVATGIYEIDGQVHEARSNRVFFINEPKEVKKFEDE